MERPHVIWLDNFSKTFGCGLQGVDTGVYRSCLWTGEAIHQYVGPPVDLDRIHLAMPDELLDDAHVKAVRDALTVADGGPCTQSMGG